MRNRILGQHGNIVGSDQFRNPVVDFRIDMIRTSGKYDSAVSGFVQEPNGLLAFFSHVIAAGGKFFPGSVNSLTDLLVGQSKFLSKFIAQPVEDRLLTLEIQERVDKINVPMDDRVHIIFNIFRIGCYDRTVVVIVCILELISFIRDGRIKNMFDPCVD